MEKILIARKITSGGIQLTDLINNEIAFDEFNGLIVRKRNDGSAIDVIGKVGSINNSDLATALTSYYTQSEVDTLITNAGGGDMLSSSNLSDLASAVNSRTNLDVRSTAQVTTEITNAINLVTLSGLGGLTESQVDARAQIKIDTLIGSADANYDTFQELQSLMEADDTETTGILTAIGLKLDKNGTIDGGTIA